MLCPSCGAENMDGASTCRECGYSLIEQAAPSRNGWILWAVLALAVVVFAGMLLSSGSGVSGGGGGASSVTATGSVEPTQSTQTTASPSGK